MRIAERKLFRPLVQHARYGQREAGDFGFKGRTVGGEKSVAAAYRADRGRDLAGAGVLIGFARGEARLFANDAEPAHLLYVLVGVGDQPVAGDQLCCGLALVFDTDAAGEDAAIFVRGRMFGLVGQRGLDEDSRFGCGYVDVTFFVSSVRILLVAWRLRDLKSTS